MKLHAVKTDFALAKENAETEEQRRIRTGWLLSQRTRDRRMRKAGPRPVNESVAACTDCGAQNLINHFAFDPLEACIACGGPLEQKRAA